MDKIKDTRRILGEDVESISEVTEKISIEDVPEDIQKTLSGMKVQTENIERISKDRDGVIVYVKDIGFTVNNLKTLISNKKFQIISSAKGDDIIALVFGN